MNFVAYTHSNYSILVRWRNVNFCKDRRIFSSFSLVASWIKLPSASNFAGGWNACTKNSGLLMKWRSRKTPICRRWNCPNPPPRNPPALTTAAVLSAHTFGGRDAQSIAFFKERTSDGEVVFRRSEECAVGSENLLAEFLHLRWKFSVYLEIGVQNRVLISSSGFPVLEFLAGINQQELQPAKPPLAWFPRLGAGGSMLQFEHFKARNAANNGAYVFPPKTSPNQCKLLEVPGKGLWIPETYVSGTRRLRCCNL
nr:hypothetical protein Iba_chr13aCG12430 [Ipomoea batatas]